MPFVDVDDSKLYYEIHGEGPPLLMVSGLRGLASHWDKQIPKFSRHFRVILHDQRGTGQSEHSLIKYSVDGLAADVIAIMGALKIERAHFIGQSTGAAIGQSLALDHPGRLLSLSLISGWTKADPYFRLNFELRSRILRLLGPDEFERFATLFVNPPWYVNAQPTKPPTGKHPPLEVTLSRIEAILAFDRTTALSQIRVPTHVVCSDDDRLTPRYFSEELAARIPGAQLSIMEGAGHSCHQTKPTNFNDIVLPFLLVQDGNVSV
jgi:aminoacrylate hydrolase